MDQGHRRIKSASWLGLRGSLGGVYLPWRNIIKSRGGEAKVRAEGGHSLWLLWLLWGQQVPVK